MKTFLTAFLLLICATGIYSQKASYKPAAPSTSPKAQSTEIDWLGTYEHSESSRNASGYVTTYTDTLTISRKGNSLIARFSNDMSNDNYECTVKASGNQLDLYYAKDLRGPDEGGFDRHLKKGKLIGSLVRTTAARGQTKYVLKNFVMSGNSLVLKKKR